MKNSIFVVALISVLGVTAVAVAKDKGPHDKAIKARQAMFQLYSFNVGVLSAMAKGKTDYNAAMAQEAADNLFAAARLGQSAMWPPGSDSESDGNAKTRALPAIWSNFPEVGKKGQALRDSTEKLSAVAGTGLEELRGAIGAVGQSCKGCHDDFRAKKK